MLPRDEFCQPSGQNKKRTISVDLCEDDEDEETTSAPKSKKKKTSNENVNDGDDNPTVSKKKSHKDVTDAVVIADAEKLSLKRSEKTTEVSAPQKKMKMSQENDVITAAAALQAKQGKSPSVNVNPSIKTPNSTNKSRIASKNAKFAVPDSSYIKLGASNSPLAIPTELMATSVSESKVLKDKRNEKSQSSSTPPKLLSTSFIRAGVHVRIPPKVLPKTTFAKSLASRPRPPPALAVKPRVEQSAAPSVEKLIPEKSSSQIRPTEVTGKASVSTPEVPKPDANRNSNSLLDQNKSDDVLLPDTSLPPPNFVPAVSLASGENLIHLPDLTKLPPPRVNEQATPLAAHSTSTAVHTDLPEETTRQPPTDLLAVNKTFLEELMDSFVRDKEEKEKSISARTRQNKIEPLKFEINVNLIKSQLGRLWKQTTAEEMKNIVDVLCNALPDLIDIRRHLLVQCIYMAVRDERKWENVRPPFGPEAPQLTVKQGKILVLLCELEKRDLFCQIVDEFLKFSRYNLFGLERLHQFKLYQLANLSRLYVTLCRFKGDEVTARLFLYDILFMKNTRTHVIISVYLDTWPHILQRPSVQGRLEPLAETVIWLIYNTGPETSKNLMKVYEARDKLQNLCGFERHTHTGPDFVKYLINVTESNIAEPKIREATTKGILLMARWNDVQWTRSKIVSRLIDVMKGQIGGASADGTTRQAEFLAWVLDSIGHVLRFYPSTDRSQLIDIYGPLQSMLLTNPMNPRLENFCLRALLWVGHHLQAQLARFFTDWHPRNSLEPDVKEMCCSYVGTRGLVFCQNLITGIKKRRISQAISSQM